MGVDILGVWSVVALTIRVIAMGALAYVAKVQIQQFRYDSPLQPLKRLLLSAVLVIIGSNIPIGYLHYVRILGIKASDTVTAIATVTNALSMLVIAVLLLLIYRFRIDE